MKKYLITGVNGFVGKHLVREFSSRNLSVIGVGMNEDAAHPEISSLLTDYYKCDVTNPTAVANLPLSEVDGIINLAGLANVGASFDQPDLYMKVNVEVLSVLGSALFSARPRARMIAVSTGALYDPTEAMPLTEASQTLEHSSPYALSKLAMEHAALKFRDSGYDCVIARPFNHIGPGQGPGFLIPDLLSKLKNVDARHPQITAGNLNTVRDYSDVRDISRAYVDLLTTSELHHPIYNVCSGTGHTGKDIVDALCIELNIQINELEIIVDKTLIRPTDPAQIIGDHKKLTDDTQWNTQISFGQTISDIVRDLA